MNGGKLVIGTELDTKKLEQELKRLEKEANRLSEKKVNIEATLKINEQEYKSKIRALNQKYNAEIAANTKFGMVQNQSAIDTKYDELRNRLDIAYGKSLDQNMFKLDQINEKIKQNADNQQVVNQTMKNAKNQTEGFSLNLSKGIKTLKRFALGIIGIRSAYTMARRAASAYMAQDEELSNKVKSFWIGLGSFLAPILEMLSNVMLKALGYLNVFIKALTGIDFIARANAKALKKQADATKQATNALSSLDEIENIDLGSKMDEKSLSDFGYIDIPELDPKIVKMLEDMAKWLKENWDWIWKVGVALAGVFLVGKLAGVLAGIGALTGALGMGGLLGILGALAVVWTIKLVMDGKEAIEKFINEVDAWKNNNVEAIEKYHKTTKKKGKETKEDAKALGQYLTGNTSRLKSQLEAIEKQKNIFTDITGQTGKLNKEQEDLIKNAGKSADEMIRLKNEGKLTAEQQQEFTNTLAGLIREADNLGISTDKLKDKYKKLTGQDYKIKVMADVQKAVDKFKEVQNAAKQVGNSKYTIKSDVDNQAINKLLGTIEALETASQSGGWISQFTNKAKLSLAKFQLQRLRGYAYGGLVTQPTRALIGEAGYPEYVVPEKSNYLSRLASNIIENMPQGAGMSDDLLLELNRNITELANRPIVINVDGKALAQATYQDFKNEENRLNSSTSVSVK